MAHDGSREADRWERGELQRHILKLVRLSGESTVRGVHEQLFQSHPVAYTTVQTVLTRLVQHGLLQRDLRCNVGVYSIVNSDDAAAADEAIEALLSRFGPLAVTRLIAQARRDPALLGELRRVVKKFAETDRAASPRSRAG